MNEEEVKNQKEIAFYSNALNAWFNTNLELDKSFLILSTAAIGFIVSFLKYSGILSKCSLIFIILSILSFLACIVLTLKTFKKNTSIIEALNENDNKELDKAQKSLKNLSGYTYWSFIFGVVFFLIYISIFFISYSNQHKNINGGNMQDKKTLNENFANIKKINPNNKNPETVQNQQNKNNSGSTKTDQKSSGASNKDKK
ncbi:MAG: 7TM-DISM domain-containing protein [Deltaproteobacteria bacterium]|nr:7TM-DISM domain-containing protein [Deltaproteobacteria bacterium]MCL5891898.1 7TM-DISM domain-containing protein [Deltaproteobacteria bacterium]